MAVTLYYKIIGGSFKPENNLSDLVSPGVARANLNQGNLTLTDAASIATDCSLGNVFTVTLGGNRTLANPTNLKSGATYTWIIKQDATGSRTLSYGSAFKFQDGVAATVSITASAVDILSAVSDGTNLYATFVGDLK